MEVAIRYESMFRPTEHTPRIVSLPEEKFRDLSHRYGAHGFDWYFVRPSVIKFYDGGAWRHAFVV